MSIFELRQYTTVAGGRDRLVELFEAQFVESQEACGMEIVGTFRDLDDESKFTWLRAFPDMSDRASRLQAFYGGSVWQAHRDAANATMRDSDNVLLLREAWEGSGFGVAGGRPAVGRSAEEDRGLVEATILSLARAADELDVGHFREVVATAVEATGACLLACLVSEESPNDFPVLPVREGEHAIVWFTGFPSLDAYVMVRPSIPDVASVSDGWPQRVVAAETLRLLPTRRSLLTGAAASHARATQPENA